MKKTTVLALSILTASSFFTDIGFAATQAIECKVQLARASEDSSEVLPKGRGNARLELSEAGATQKTLTFSLGESTDLVYKLELSAQTKSSNWSSDALAFDLEVRLWDVKNNKLVAAQTLNSDNVRTRFLLDKLLSEDTAVIASDVPSFEMRSQLLNSEDASVVGLAQQGQWILATHTALSKALVHPLLADFLSLNCILKN